MKKPAILVDTEKLVIDIAPKAGSNTIMSIFLENKKLRSGPHLKEGTYWNYLKNNNMGKLSKDKILIKIVREPYERALSVYNHFNRSLESDISADSFFERVQDLHTTMQSEKMSLTPSKDQIKKATSIFPELKNKQYLVEILGLQKNYDDIRFDHLFRLGDIEKSVVFLNKRYSLNFKSHNIGRLNASYGLKKLTKSQKSLVYEIYSEDFLLYSAAEFTK